MKKNYIFAIAAFASILLSAPSSAQHALGLGVTRVDIDESGVGITTNSVTIAYDNKINQNFGIQVGGAFGGDDTIMGVKAEVESIFFGKLKGGFTTGNTFFYATAGYARAELEASAGGFSVSDNSGGAIVGVGVDIPVGDTYGVGLEYTRGFNDLEDANVFQAIFRYRF